LKVPILAMSLLLGCSSPRLSRPRWRSAGRRRSTTHPLWAGAQRRMAAERLSCFARNGRTGVPARLRAGWHAQGKKVSPPPLRQRRSRHSRPLARSSHRRPYGSPGPRYSRRTRGGYRAVRTRGRAHRAKKKKLLRRERRSLVAVQTGRQRAGIIIGIGATEVATWLAVKRRNKTDWIRTQRSDSRQSHSTRGMASQSVWSVPLAG